MLILLVIYDGILKMPKLYTNRNRELGIGSYTVEDIEHVGSFFFFKKGVMTPFILYSFIIILNAL